MSGYKDSFYKETKSEVFVSDDWLSRSDTDVCVIGGGIAGLSCAQSLIEGGCNVAVLEANKIFSGASGLNGGFVSPGFSLSLPDLERIVGLPAARRLFNITLQGLNKIEENINRFNLHTARTGDGKIVFLRHKPSEKELNLPQDMWSKYKYPVEAFDKYRIKDIVSSDRYQYGYLHEKAFHIHPLNYGVGLARNLQSKGVKIFENQCVKAIKKIDSGFEIITPDGKLRTSQVVVTTGGYTSGEVPRLTRSVLPITTFVAVSEPNEDIKAKYIKTSCALGDTRRASDYYRIVDGNRLLWGGRITAFPTVDLKEIKNLIHEDIQKVFPGLKGLDLPISWSGVMGYSIHKMPYIGRFDNGIWFCTAFGGHGLASGTGCGMLVGNSILKKETDINLFKPFKVQNTFGILGRIAVEITYKKYIIVDRIKEAKAGRG